MVAYGRTLTSGVRSGITLSQLDKLSPQLRETHRYIKDYRDKYVAHSVNAFEESLVKAYLVPEERGPRAVSSISVSHARIQMLSQMEMAALSDLAKSLSLIVAADIETEKNFALAYAQSLPIDELYESESDTGFSARDVPVSTSRGKFK